MANVYILWCIVLFWKESEFSCGFVSDPFKTFLMYTCMLKIISPPFYCAVMLMDSCVTFYFHYNFCKEHEKLKCLSNL